MSLTKFDLVACAKRELALREKLYPRFISQGKMTAAKASFEIRCQRAIIDRLEALPDDPPVQPALFPERGRRA